MVVHHSEVFTFILNLLICCRLYPISKFSLLSFISRIPFFGGFIIFCLWLLDPPSTIIFLHISLSSSSWSSSLLLFYSRFQGVLLFHGPLILDPSSSHHIFSPSPTLRFPLVHWPSLIHCHNFSLSEIFFLQDNSEKFLHILFFWLSWTQISFNWSVPSSVSNICHISLMVYPPFVVPLNDLALHIL